MMAGKLIITGDKVIAAMLRRVGDPKSTNKIVRKALRNGAKSLLPAVKNNIPVASGAMKKAAKIKAGKRSRKGPTMFVMVSAEDIVAANPELSERDASFYPMAVEFGDANNEPQAPFRKAFDSLHEVVAESMNDEIKREVMKLVK